MIITFETIALKDLEIVLELFKNAAEKIEKMNVDHWQYWKNPPKEKIEWVEEGIEKNEFFFINESNGKNIGMVRVLDEDLMYWGKQKEKTKYIHSLVVKEEYNGKGIGSKVIHEIQKKAREENCKYLRLDADSKNVKLCQYYEKLGFKQVGTKRLPLSTNNLYQKEIQ